MACTVRVMWAWSQKPQSRATDERGSLPLTVLVHANRPRAWARYAEGLTPKTFRNPRDTVASAKPRQWAQSRSRRYGSAKSAVASSSGQSVA